MRRASQSLIAVLWIVACGSEGSPTGGVGVGDKGSGESRATESFAPAAETSAPTPPKTESCKRIDLVFSVDNSGSMSEEKASIRDVVFPAFAERLKAIGKGLDDYRAGVVDACPLPATFHTRGTAGACNFHGGKAWMESASPNLIGEFKCVGDLWSGDMQCSGKNDDEQPSSSIAAALELAKADPAGPNSGFLRDDALLVAIAITDEDEQPTTTDKSAASVYERLIALKGDVKRMVFLGIGGMTACSGAYGTARESAKLREITRLFEAQGRGVFWDLCAGKLEDGLGQALTVIEQACDEFVPATTR